MEPSPLPPAAQEKRMDTDEDNTDGDGVADEDDPVLHEMDVLLSQDLARALYLVQYPQRSTDAPYGAPKGVRFKPQHQLLEIEHALDTKAPWYDEYAAEGVKRPTLRLLSTSVPPAAQYAVGTVHDGQLHITPLAGVFQMRSDLSHLQGSGSGAAAASAAGSGDEAEEDATGDAGAEDTKPTVVQVRYKKRESERALAAKRNSYAHLKEKEREEPWVALTAHEPESDSSQRQFRKLMCRAPGTDIATGQPVGDYVKSMQLPLEETGEADDTPDALRPVALSALKEMSGREQVLTLLRKGMVLPYAQIKRLCTACGTDAALLAALEEVAVLVRGNWVLKSSVLYHNEVAIACRDAVLLAFRLHAKLSRHALAEALPIDTDSVRNILQGIAIQRKEERLWEFKQRTDEQFIEMHDEVVVRQHGQWQDELARITAVLGTDTMQRVLAANHPVPLTQPRFSAMPALGYTSRSDLLQPPPLFQTSRDVLRARVAGQFGLGSGSSGGGGASGQAAAAGAAGAPASAAAAKAEAVPRAARRGAGRGRGRGRGRRGD